MLTHFQMLFGYLWKILGTFNINKALMYRELLHYYEGRIAADTTV